MYPLQAAQRGSYGCGRCPRPGDQRQNVGEYLSRYGDLGHLEGHITPVADDLGADLDQFLAQASQRPRLCRRGYRQSAHEVAEVVGQRVELRANGIGCGGAA